MKKFFSFVRFFLIVLMALLFISGLGFAKKSKKAWLNDMPGKPPRAYLSKYVYMYSDSDNPGVNVSSSIVKLAMKSTLWIDPPAASSSAVSGVLGIEISTATLVGGTSVLVLADLTQPGISINLTVGFDEETSTVTYCTVRFDGVNGLGVATYENIIATAGATTVGNVAFATISTVTVGALPTEVGTVTDSTFKLMIGIGEKLGLKGDIQSSDDLVKGTVDGVDETDDFTLDSDYDTVTHSDPPDASDDWLLDYFYNSVGNPR